MSEIKRSFLFQAAGFITLGRFLKKIMKRGKETLKLMHSSLMSEDSIKFIVVIEE